MKPYRIYLQILVRNTLLAIAIEALLGGLYALVFIAVTLITGGTSAQGIDAWLNLLFGILFAGTIAFPLGAAIGATIGVVTGALNGLLVGVLTVVAFFPLTNVPRYRLIIGLISAATTILIFDIIAWQIMYWIIPFPTGPANTPSTASVPIWRYSIWPALIAGAGAWWVSSLVARWYAGEATAVPHEQPAL